MRSRIGLFLLVLAALLASQHATLSAQNSAERLSVIDGDTLQVDGTIVQLYGIDAPELGQLCQTDQRLWPCGADAALALEKLVSLNRPTLHCAPWGKNGGSAPYPVIVSVCEIGDQDLAVLMLDGGHSLALPGAFPDYLDAERQAREAHLGIWQSHFVPPWDWRAGVRAPGRRSDATRECNVKGVVGADGERLYYVPTDAEYGTLAIDPKQGERMVCGDEEARLAGWRRMGEKSGAGEQTSR